jgi:hypothetical protein
MLVQPVAAGWGAAASVEGAAAGGACSAVSVSGAFAALLFASEHPAAIRPIRQIAASIPIVLFFMRLSFSVGYFL